MSSKARTLESKNDWSCFNPASPTGRQKSGIQLPVSHSHRWSQVLPASYAGFPGVYRGDAAPPRAASMSCSDQSLGTVQMVGSLGPGSGERGQSRSCSNSPEPRAKPFPSWWETPGAGEVTHGWSSWVVDRKLASPFPPDTLTHLGWAASDSPALSPSFIYNQEMCHWRACGIFWRAQCPPRNLGGGVGEGEWKREGKSSGWRTLS